jgi:hypothetical protein
MGVTNVQLKIVLRGYRELRMRLRLLLARQRRAHFSHWDTEKASVNG